MKLKCETKCLHTFGDRTKYFLCNRPRVTLNHKHSTDLKRLHWIIRKANITFCLKWVVDLEVYSTLLYLEPRKWHHAISPPKSNNFCSKRSFPYLKLNEFLWWPVLNALYIRARLIDCHSSHIRFCQYLLNRRLSIEWVATGLNIYNMSTRSIKV